MANNRKIDKGGFEYLVGVDEVGRGPIAGPVMVGIVAVPYKNSRKILNKLAKKGLRDSKKLSESKREELYKDIWDLYKNNEIFFKTPISSAKTIDKKGISKCISHSISTNIRNFNKISLKPHKTKIKLDGLLKAPEEYIHQETIIKGDDKELVIALASVIAKVRRDRMMISYHKKFSKYGFDVHKGYGTKRHLECIKKHGLCELHRESFCGRLK